MANQASARTTIKRRLASPAYSAGVRNTTALDRDGVLQALNVRVQFNVVTTATAPVGALWQTLSRLIRRLEVVVNGADTVVSMDGPHLASRAHIETGVRAMGMDATVSLATSTTTAYDVTIPVEFFLRNNRRPDDCALDLRQVQQATLGITWGDQTDLFTTPNGATITGATCEVEAVYIINEDPKASYFTRALDMMTISNPSSNANLAILMDRGSNLWWKSFHLASLRNQVFATNIITSDMRVVAGSLTYRNVSPQLNQASVIRDYCVPYAELPSSERIYRFDFTNLGQNTTLINAGALAGDLYMYLGTTYTSGTETFTVSREAMRMLRI